MTTTSPLRAALAAGTALALGVAFVGPASGADPKPAYSGCGTKYAKAGSGGITNQEGQDVPAADIVGAWAELSSTKGPVAEMVIKNLTGTVDPPNTSITYDFKYATDADHFVRAYLDYSGMVYFEYGHTDATVPVTTRYVYDGPTKGALYPGENGVVEIVVPPEAGGKVGTTVKGLTAETQIGETTAVPGAVNQSPSRGLSQQADSLGMGNWLISPCAAGGGGGGTTTPTPGTSTPGGGTTTPRFPAASRPSRSRPPRRARPSRSRSNPRSR